METTAAAVFSRTAECAALVVIGYQLRSAQLFSATDAEAAQRLAGYLTLPALVLQSCNTLPAVSWPALIGAPVVLLSSAAAAGFTWSFFSKRHKRERAVLAGCAVGNDAPAVAVPLIEALAGPAGVVAACGGLIANSLTVYLGSYLLTASAGPAFPESYQHEDGGSYRGEWRGMNKEGLGVYTYASGARYEGEWRDNLKAGRGVYYFPKGGTYEGEWAAGVMSGTGLRTYSSGRVAAGRWDNGQLVAPLELWQCANAAEGAAEAALAARRVVVGGGKPADAAQLLLLQPVLWAALVGLTLNALAVPLPGSVAAVAAALAPANKPLMLLSAGMMLQPVLPQPRQVRDVTVLMAARVSCALFFTANALALLHFLPALPLPSTAAAAAAVAAGTSSSITAATTIITSSSAAATTQLGMLSVLAAAVMLMSPLPPAAMEFTRNFRLNEALAGACRDASVLAAGPLLLLLVVAVGGLGLLPPVLPLSQGAGDWLAGAAYAAAGDGDTGAAATVLAAAMMLLASAVAAAAGVVWDRLAPSKGKMLKYAGSSSGKSADAADADAPTESSSSSSGDSPKGIGSEPPSSSSSSSSGGSGSSSSSGTSLSALPPGQQQPSSRWSLPSSCCCQINTLWLGSAAGAQHCRVLQPGRGVQGFMERMNSSSSSSGGVRRSRRVGVTCCATIGSSMWSCGVPVSRPEQQQQHQHRQQQQIRQQQTRVRQQQQHLQGRFVRRGMATAAQQQLRVSVM